MALRAVELGIKAIQIGSRAEGGRLLRYALKQDQRRPILTGDQRATAYLWLAETSDDPAQRRACYAAAVQHAQDPALSADARARLNALVASAPAQAAQPAPANVNVALFVARVLDGAHGAATAVYVDGMWVTTRYAVGGSERLTVELHQRGRLVAQVAESSPELDIALLLLEHAPPGDLPVGALPPDQETPLVALAFDGTVTRGAVRPTNRAMPAHLLPTDFTALPDAGGDPLFDPFARLVGILTRSTARSADHLFGVKIEAIKARVAAFRAANTGQLVYCPLCGSRSRALAAGYHYCETCGGAGTRAPAVRAFQPGSERVYVVNSAPCAACGAAVGSYRGLCLRCGRAVAG